MPSSHPAPPDELDKPLELDPSDWDMQDNYFLLTGLVVPRPIAWVSTLAPDGTRNAAPYSYFQAVTTKPPMVMIAGGLRRDGRRKDTRAHIEATGEYVVNIVSEPSAQRMVDCSIAFEPDVSEFDEIGLEAAPSKIVKAPRIAECKVSLECKLDRVLEVGHGGGTMILGEVVWFHVADNTGWVSLAGVRADPTTPDETGGFSDDGGRPVPADDACSGTLR